MNFIGGHFKRVQMRCMGLCGMDFTPDGTRFHPLAVPGIFPLVLTDLPYRKLVLNLEITGQGEQIAACHINGVQVETAYLAADANGPQQIQIQLA